MAANGGGVQSGAGLAICAGAYVVEPERVSPDCASARKCASAPSGLRVSRFERRAPFCAIEARWLLDYDSGLARGIDIKPRDQEHLFMFKFLGIILAAMPIVLLLRSVFFGKSKKRSQAMSEFKKHVDYVVWVILFFIGCAVVYAIGKLVYQFWT
jgi:hypothetical protein